MIIIDRHDNWTPLWLLPEVYWEVLLQIQSWKMKLNVSLYICSVVEVAVVGPPNLLRVGFKPIGPMTMMTIAWVRSPNDLTQLLPICFAVNTKR